MRPAWKRLLLPAALVAFAWGAVALGTGGVSVHVAGILIRARGAERPLILGFVLLLAYAALSRDRFTAATDRASAMLRRSAAAVAAAAAVLLAACAIYFGTFTAGGSDPYGYVNQAYAWARGELPRPAPLLLKLPFPGSDVIQSPLGYRNGPEPHTIVPTYAPGLPLFMAAAALVAGHAGPFFVVPASAALLVWLTFLFGRHAAGPVCGVIAAVVVLTSPIVLYQSVYPMSDVPAAAIWTGAAVAALGTTRRRALLTGLLTGVGLLVRPNLLLLAVVPVLHVGLSARGRDRWIHLAICGAAILPMAMFIAWLNAIWYGAPWNSGYGSAGELYATANLRANLWLFPSWFLQSQSPWALVGLASLVPALIGRYADRRAILLALSIVVATFLSYVAYATFEPWWYLRFMLPGIGAAAVLIAAGAVTIARAIPRPWGRVAAATVLLLMMVKSVAFTANADVFGGIKAGERRYADIGAFIAQNLPDNAVVLAMQHSGSVRLYGGRLTLRYDLLGKEWARLLPAELERSGYHPFMAIDDWEVPYVRAGFGLPEDSPLPWQMFAHMRELGGVTILDLSSHPVASPISLEPGGSAWCPVPQPFVLKPAAIDAASRDR